MKDKIIAMVEKAGNFLKLKCQEQDPKHVVAGVAVVTLILILAIWI